MADRPILFSAPMVRALLDGRKTQTRRTLKPQPEEHPGMNCRRLRFFNKKGDLVADASPDEGGSAHLFAGFAVGDRLWVKETYRFEARWDALKPSEMRKGSPVYSEAAPYEPTPECAGICRPSIFMPRWASRLTLTVTDVRVERLQDISETDAIAEGIEPTIRTDSGQFYRNYDNETCPIMAYGAYRSLWNHINGPGAWEANPWVVAISFDVRKGNIDA